MGKMITSQEFSDLLAKGQQDEALVVKEFAVEKIQADEETRTVKFVITTGDVDRDNDVINPKGWDLSDYMRSPVVLWAHDYKMPPIAKGLDVVPVPNGLASTAQFPELGVYPFADMVFRLIKGGFIRACSVGFKPKKAMRNEERGGVDFEEQSLMEWSICPVPANPRALVAASQSGIDLSLLKTWVKSLDIDSAQPEPPLRADDSLFEISLEKESGRWNDALSKSFDVSAQQFPPLSIEQDLAAKYCGCEIRNLRHTEEPVMATYMGTFLYALDKALEPAMVDDIRNVNYRGQEEPPQYETIQLNSKRAQDFLVCGMRFFRLNDVKMAQRVVPRWYGLDVVTYAAQDQKAAERGLMAQVKGIAEQTNFLKGEAFTLAGKFIERSGGESIDDLMLDEKNGQVARMLVQLVQDKGAEMENRGVLLVGPPGTGKTTFGRVLLGDAKQTTFVWLSARDFWHAGGANALPRAFDLAKKNAPSVLFIEDVDNWLDGYTIDFLKTEMDGITKGKGVMTVLTTNYPEHLPKALIDRPGRFHDVLRFDLPDEKVRGAMLAKWMPSLSEADRAKAVAATAGYSGAHLRELARFASIISEQEKLGPSEALVRALEKLKEQRDLITSVQSQGSRYRAPVHVTGKAETVQAVTKSTEPPKAGDEIVIDFDEVAAEVTDGVVLSLEEEDGISFDADDIKAALRDVIAAQVGDAVREATQRTMNQMRGRVD